LIRSFSRRQRVYWAIWALAAACGVAAAYPATCYAQTAAHALVETQPLAARTDLVRLDVSVLDKHGNFVSGLTKNDFSVMDGGVQQPIAFFAPVEAPAHILVMIETSPAVYLIHDEHLAAAYALVQGLDPADQVALVTYSDKPHETLGFTTNKPALLSALDSLQFMIGMGELNFYDSLSAVIDSFPPGEGKSAVVLLTTGIDSSPASHWQRLVRRLRGTDVVVFSVALGGVLREDSGRQSRRQKHKKEQSFSSPATADSLGNLAGFARADRALQLLARMTGGRAYFPRSDNNFAPVYREIAAALRHQYVLGIVPANDGEFHPLTVEVLPDGTDRGKKQPRKSRYKVFSREGYIAPAS
jgi:Ca-activated chloride channel family protein